MEMNSQDTSEFMSHPQRVRSPFHHVLVPTDGSAASIDAGRLGIRIAHAHQIPITFLYVVNRKTAAEIAAASSSKTVEIVCRELGHKAHSYLDYLIRAAEKESLEAHEIIRSGVPYREIASLAREQGVDLIVIGQVGGRGTKQHHRAHIGSVTEHVIEHAPCPVLVVRHDSVRR